MEELTRKQKGFVKDYLESGNATDAVKKNYNVSNDLTARVIGSENLTKPNIIKAIKSIAEQIPDELLLQVQLDGLKATKSSEVDEPDYAIRHKYLDTALKLKGLYEDTEQRNINVLMPVLVKFLDKKDE